MKPKKSAADIPELAGKPQKIIVHKPFYADAGCTVVRRWKENFTDRAGSTAVLTHIEYTDKKGRPHEAVIQVEWINLILGGSKVQKETRDASIS